MKNRDNGIAAKLRRICMSAMLMASLLAGVIIPGDVEVYAEEEQKNSIEELSEDSAVIGELTEAMDTGDEDSDQETLEVLSSRSVKWNDNFSKKDLMYMASIIYCEAGSLSRDAKIGVANVILNRMENDRDWAHVDTVKEVIYDKKWGVQFSPAYSKSSNNMKNAVNIYKNISDYEGTWRYTAMKESIEAAKAAFCGEKAVPDSYLYFNAHISSSKARCKANDKSYIIIGAHIYY